MKACSQLKIKQIFTTWNNPKGNADTERVFRTLKEDLVWTNEWHLSFEFQGDLELWQAIHEAPESVLRVTMAHCDTDDPSQIIEGDSVQALDWASRNMEALRESALTCERERLLFVYEIMDPNRPRTKQIGLGGMARTEEIRTAANPEGPIIRNEGIREPKARGRAKLVEATGAIVGTVNLAIEDQSGRFAAALDRQVGGIPPHYEVTGNGRTVHRIWLTVGERLRGKLQRKVERRVARPGDILHSEGCARTGRAV